MASSAPTVDRPSSSLANPRRTRLTGTHSGDLEAGGRRPADPTAEPRGAVGR